MGEWERIGAGWKDGKDKIGNEDMIAFVFFFKYPFIQTDSDR